MDPLLALPATTSNFLVSTHSIIHCLVGIQLKVDINLVIIILKLNRIWIDDLNLFNVMIRFSWITMATDSFTIRHATVLVNQTSMQHA